MTPDAIPARLLEVVAAELAAPPDTKRRTTAMQRLMRLRGLRPGKHERWILREAAGPAYHHAVVTGSGMSRSLSQARRRAAIRLRHAGLTRWSQADELTCDVHGRQRWYWHRAATLSEVGRVVVAVLGDVLYTNRPIRWATYWSALEAAAPALDQRLATLEEQLATNLRQSNEALVREATP